MTSPPDDEEIEWSLQVEMDEAHRSLLQSADEAEQEVAEEVERQLEYGEDEWEGEQWKIEQEEAEQLDEEQWELDGGFDAVYDLYLKARPEVSPEVEYENHLIDQAWAGGSREAARIQDPVLVFQY